MRGLLNPAVRRDAAFRGLFSADEYAAVAAFYDARHALAPTALLNLPSLASFLGISALMVKDESSRFGLSAFKSLGALYAMSRLGQGALDRGVVCATAGNHGRGVARAARDLGVPCTVFVPGLSDEAGLLERAIRNARVAGMRQDGAQIVDVAGSYEQAVERAAIHAAETGATIVSDTSRWGRQDPEALTRDIMAGYTRLFDEASRQWSAPPDVVFVQAGVGGLLCAAASWFAFHAGQRRPFLIACEPDGSACLLGTSLGSPGSAAAGEPRTMMAGLRCAEPSMAAWPTVRDGVDAFVSIPDGFAVWGMETLAAPASGDQRIDAGPSGACSVGTLRAVLTEPVLAPIREAAGLGRTTRVLAIVTEGK